MFVDASVIVSILVKEDDADALFARMQGAETIVISLVVVFEAALGTARITGSSIEQARQWVHRLLNEFGGTVAPIDDDIANRALEAFTRYGKGQHKARLNMGDCFAYACAKAYGLPLLFKGNDFGHTDIMQA